MTHIQNDFFIQEWYWMSNMIRRNVEAYIIITGEFIKIVNHI
jgi:hypothetical protein